MVTHIYFNGQCHEAIQMFKSYEEFKNYTSNRLADLRCKKKISARDMSLSLGQGKGYINSIENKRSMPSMKVFFYICEFFKITPKEFFDEEVKNPERLKQIIADLKGLNNEQLATVEAVVKGLKK